MVLLTIAVITTPHVAQWTDSIAFVGHHIDQRGNNLQSAAIPVTVELKIIWHTAIVIQVWTTSWYHLESSKHDEHDVQFPRTEAILECVNENDLSAVSAYISHKETETTVTEAVGTPTSRKKVTRTKRHPKVDKNEQISTNGFQIAGLRHNTRTCEWEQANGNEKSFVVPRSQWRYYKPGHEDQF